MQGEGDQQQHNNNQDRNVNKQQPQQQGQQQHNEPQKCPRCESLNTKFCYYNNYSLSQPRFFCKACKRYWTKGGTLRNVPVGGGCRKGSKRAKTMSSSSSATSSRTVLQPQQQQDHQLHERSLMMSTGPAAMNLGQCYSGGTGYLTSSSFNQNLGHLGGSGQLGSSGRGVSDLGLLHGFNAISSFGQRQLQTQPFNSMEPPPLYPLSQDHRGLMLQPAMSGGSVTDWSKSFINKSHASASAAAASTGHNTLWSTTMGNNTSSTSGAGPSLNSSQDDHAASYAAGLPP